MTDQLSPRLGGQPRDQSPSLAREWHTLRQTHVWLIDDSRDISAMVVYFFERYCGFSVTVFGYTSTLEDHLAGLAATDTPTFVLVDDYIPDMTGITILETLLKPHPLVGDIPAVLFTVMGRSEVHQRARWAGFDRVFMKPFDLNALAALATHYTGIRLR